MRNPAPLPDEIEPTAFDRATAARGGVPVGRLRRRDIRRPFHGVQSTVRLETVEERCAAYAVRLKPGQAFSHTTAALLHRVPLPLEWTTEPALHITAVMPAPAPQTRGVVGHRLRISPPIVTVGGLPVVRVDEAWCQLAGVLEVVDLVVAADAILASSGAEAAAARAALAAAVSAQQRIGARRLSDALGLARAGSASPGETRVRLLLVGAGLPEPELNAPIDTPDGRILGRGDLVFRRQRLVLEYEGDQHRTDRNQFRYDIERYERFKQAGWTVVRVTADDLRPERRAALIERVRRYLDA